MPSRTNRFQSFTPLRSTTTSTSLRRLRTAFSPNRSLSTSSTSSSSTSTTSPLTRDCSPASQRSSASANIRHALALRRRPSVLEFEMRREREVFGSELEVLEPRPGMGLDGEVGVVVGIFEVLDGKF